MHTIELFADPLSLRRAWVAVVRCLCFSLEWVLGVEFRCSPVGVMVWRLSRRFRFRSPRGVLPPPSPSPPASVSRRFFRGVPVAARFSAGLVAGR